MNARSFSFDPGSHTFSHGKVKLSSVTKILVQSGIVDTSYLPPGMEYLERGITIHDLTARHDEGEPIDLRYLKPRWRGHYRAWLRFLKETGFTPTLIEHYVQFLVSSCQHNSEFCCCFAGVIDRVGTFPRQVDDIETILDIKNMKTGRVGDWVRYQLVGYGHALAPKEKKRRMGVALHADGTYAVTGCDKWPISTWDMDKARFLKASRDVNTNREFSRRRVEWQEQF